MRPLSRSPCSVMQSDRFTAIHKWSWTGCCGYCYFCKRACAVLILYSREQWSSPFTFYSQILISFLTVCGLDAVSCKNSICIWKWKRDRVENVTTRWRSCWLRNLCRLSSWAILRFKKSETRFGHYFMCVTLLEFDFWHWLSAIHPHTQTKLVIPAGHSVVAHTQSCRGKKEISSETFFPDHEARIKCALWPRVRGS